MHRDLTDIPDRPGAHALSRICARLTVAPAQERTADGLVASLAIGNRGHKEVALLNPFELMELQLLDAAGAPVAVPRKPPAMLVHRVGDEGWRVRNPLRVREVHQNGTLVAATAVDGKVLLLAPGDEYEVTVEIVEVQADDTATLAPIADGAYRLGCIATLISATTPADSRIVQAAPLEVRFARR